jgi:hypothetical protein
MGIRLSEKAKKVVSVVAPSLGAALGGPLGGLAGQILGGLVSGGKVADLEEAILTQKPETLLALKKLEQDYILKLEELGVEQSRVEAADRASARDMAKIDMRPQMIISATFLGGYFLILLLRMSGAFEGVPDDKVVDNLLTALTYGVPLILAFWFGSTAGSARKSQLLAEANPADARQTGNPSWCLSKRHGVLRCGKVVRHQSDPVD